MDQKYYYVSRNQLDVGVKIWPFQYSATNCELLSFVKHVLSKDNLDILESLFYTDCYFDLQVRNAKRILPSALIEVIFEKVRSEEFKDKQSRWETVHLFDNLDNALNFRKKYRQDKGYIHTASIKSGIHFRGDMKFVNPGVDLAKDFSEELKLMRERAKSYWSGKITEKPVIEILVKGDVIVEQLMDSR